MLRAALPVAGLILALFVAPACADDEPSARPSSPSTPIGRNFFCTDNPPRCEAARALFACDIANATRIVERGPESGMFLVSKKECSIVEARTPVEVQPTGMGSVAYVTSRGVHVGYVPRETSVPYEAFARFPDALRGVWEPTLEACRAYSRTGPDEANDGANLLIIGRDDISGYEVVRHLLLLSRTGPRSWRVAFRAASDGDEWAESVTLVLSPDGLSLLYNDERFVRCVGASTPAERAAAREEWQSYTDSRFGVFVEYPAYLVAGGPVTDLTDGRPGAATRLPTGISLSSNEGVEIRIYGMVAGETPYARMCATGCAGETYAMKRPAVAVVSGRRGDFIYYRRCRSAEDGRSLHCFDLEYPRAKHTAMQLVIDRMTRTLR